jgi:hypothetical protein
MTDARPFTVVCVADDSRSTKRGCAAWEWLCLIVRPNTERALLFLGLVIARTDCKPLAHVGPVCGFPIIFRTAVV